MNKLIVSFIIVAFLGGVASYGTESVDQIKSKNVIRNYTVESKGLIAENGQWKSEKISWVETKGGVIIPVITDRHASYVSKKILNALQQQKISETITLEEIKKALKTLEKSKNGKEPTSWQNSSRKSKDDAIDRLAATIDRLQAHKDKAIMPPGLATSLSKITAKALLTGIEKKLESQAEIFEGTYCVGFTGDGRMILYSVIEDRYYVEVTYRQFDFAYYTGPLPNGGYAVKGVEKPLYVWEIIWALERIEKSEAVPSRKDFIKID